MQLTRSAPETVMPSSGLSAVTPRLPANVDEIELVVTEPTTTRAASAPAATQGGTITVSDVSASTRTTLPRAVPNSAVLPSGATLNARPRNRTVSPDANVAGTTTSSRGGGVATTRKCATAAGA